jgi:hypothetical protein
MFLWSGKNAVDLVQKTFWHCEEADSSRTKNMLAIVCCPLHIKQVKSNYTNKKPERMQRLASDCASLLPESIPWTTPTKHVSPLHPCKRGLNLCVCLYMELGRLLYLFNINERNWKGVWYATHCDLFFWFATSTTRLARISVGCDGTKSSSGFCVARLEFRCDAANKLCCVMSGFRTKDLTELLRSRLSRVSQFGVVQ